MKWINQLSDLLAVIIWNILVLAEISPGFGIQHHEKRHKWYARLSRFVLLAMVSSILLSGGG